MTTFPYYAKRICRICCLPTMRRLCYGICTRQNTHFYFPYVAPRYLVQIQLIKAKKYHTSCCIWYKIMLNHLVQTNMFCPRKYSSYFYGVVLDFVFVLFYLNKTKVLVFAKYICAYSREACRIRRGRSLGDCSSARPIL